MPMPPERVALCSSNKSSTERWSSESSSELGELVPTVSTDPPVSVFESPEEFGFSCLLLLSLFLLVSVSLDLVALFCFRESSGIPSSFELSSEL